jgi:hypothetical protein
MDDEGISRLAELPKLRWLNLSNTGKTSEVVEKLKAGRAGLEIVE